MHSHTQQTASTVGIIMPCYNLGAFIPTAIDSILRQTYTHYTVYIIDDASPDSTTHETLQKLAQKLPSNFVFDYQTKNRGMHRVTNYAAKKVTADYLFIFSPDDELKETYLEETVHYLDTHPETAAVCTWLEYFGENTGVKKYSKDSCTLPAMLLENGFSGAAVIRKDAWNAVGGYDEHRSQKVHEDYNLWLAMLRSGYTLGVVPRPLLRYRIRADSLSHSIDSKTEIAWVRHITTKYSDLFEQYASTVVRHIWEESIQTRLGYRKAMNGHEWLDREYKNQVIKIRNLEEENRFLLNQLSTIKSSKVYRLARRVHRLFTPPMRKKG